MTNFNLSICMPSNRNHNGSRASISSALNFCDLTNSELIVSDNSYDIKKSNFWNNLNLNFLKYEKDAPLESNSNWHNALSKSHGLYAGILSDDDLIYLKNARKRRRQQLCFEVVRSSSSRSHTGLSTTHSAL